MIIIVIVGLILVALFTYVIRLENAKTKLTAQVESLRRDTTFKANEIIVLKYDTSHYRANLVTITRLVDSLKKADKQRNPGLYDKFPTIEEIKRNKL